MVVTVLYSKEQINDKIYLFSPIKIIGSLSTNDSLMLNSFGDSYYKISKINDVKYLDGKNFVGEYSFPANKKELEKVKKSLLNSNKGNKILGYYDYRYNKMHCIKIDSNCPIDDKINAKDYINLINYYEAKNEIMNDISCDSLILSYFNNLVYSVNSIDYEDELPLKKCSLMVRKYIELIDFCYKEKICTTNDINFNQLSKTAQNILIKHILELKDNILDICTRCDFNNALNYIIASKAFKVSKPKVFSLNEYKKRHTID